MTVNKIFRIFKKVQSKTCEQTLSVESVTQIHDHLARAFAEDNDPISPAGVKNVALLEMAVSRQHVGFGGVSKYPTAVLNAATLMYGLCNDHPFHNGNKRTALIAGIMHLDKNGLVLDNVTRDELYNLMLRIANHEMTDEPHTRVEKSTADADVEAIADWLVMRTRKIIRGERTITYRQLIRILQKFEHLRVEDSGFQITVYWNARGGLFDRERERRYLFQNPGDHRDVSTTKIKEIRDALGLTEANGVDSVSFYDNQTTINDFITRHRGVLRRLARV